VTDFNIIQELALIKEIMAVVERHDKTHGITPRPDTIRDTMLCVAALLHIDASSGENARQNPGLEETFLDNARGCLAKVRDASSARPRSILQ